MNLSVGVLGTGVVGLSTALRLQEVLPDANLTVIGENFGKETTSHGAAGNFYPQLTTSLTKDIGRLRRWFKASFERYSSLLYSDESYEAGITALPYILFGERTSEELELLSDFSINLRRLNINLTQHLNLPASYSDGYIFDSFLLEPRYYMPYLVEKITSRNGYIERRHIDSFDDLSTEFDLLINCTGLGSRRLCNDEKIYPVRGQLIRVHAPWIKHGFMGPDYAYIFPARQSVVLGGCSQAHNYNTEIDPEDRKSILERTERIVPSLRHATVIEEWVGLRPRRDELRLEIDTKSCRIPVVHNYGHFAKGVSLSWGTAVEAVTLAKRALRTSRL